MTDTTDRGLAFGKPGLHPKWTTSAKQGVGTAATRASRVWFTIAEGILTEVYYPTIDRPQIKDLQLIITDGRSFCHEERRDLEHHVELLDRGVLGYCITSRDPDGRYALEKEILSDAEQPCVLMRVRLKPASQWLGKLRAYVVMAPHIEVRGWHNNARRHSAAGRPILVAWRRAEGRATYAALGCDPPFTRTSCGYSGVSDGWADLMDNMRMDWEFDYAEDGAVAVTGEVDLSRGGEFTVVLAFGDSVQSAAARLVQSLARPFADHRARFIATWRELAAKDNGPPFDPREVAGDGGRLFEISHRLLQAHEDKRFAGAFIASPSIPWGEAKGDEYLGGYHLAWPRDMFHQATALMAVGDYDAALRALIYLACSQRPDGSFPANFWLDGTPHNTGLQLDEVAFPVMLAWRLWKAGRLAEFDPYPMVEAAARCLVVNGPATEQERWEDASGYSPSTLASNIAALICAAEFARSRGKHKAASFLEDYADFLEAHLEQWTVTNNGTLVPGIRRHFIRILPADVRNPRPIEDPDQAVLWVSNQPPGKSLVVPAKDVVDAGFLELVRYGIRRPGDALIEDSLRVVDAVLKVDTPFGPCWRRYSYDGYGQRDDGGPYLGWGRGRAWPLLTGERGHYELAAGRRVRPFIEAMERFAAGCGMLPEQVWDEPDRPELGLYFGRPTGAAMPLAWAHAEYVKLLRSAHDGAVFDMLPVVAERYLSRGGRKDLEVWKPNRQITQMRAGDVLRIQAPEPFRLHWSDDNWATVNDTDAADSGIGVYYVDLPTRPHAMTVFKFTFFWTARDRWQGEDYEVTARP